MGDGLSKHTTVALQRRVASELHEDTGILHAVGIHAGHQRVPAEPVPNVWVSAVLQEHPCHHQGRLVDEAFAMDLVSTNVQRRVPRDILESNFLKQEEKNMQNKCKGEFFNFFNILCLKLLSYCAQDLLHIIINFIHFLLIIYTILQSQFNRDFFS